MSSILFHCRSGQENTLCAELNERLNLWGLPGYSQPGPGLVIWQASGSDWPSLKGLASSLVFARSLLPVVAELPAMPAQDRISALLAALSAQAAKGLKGPFGGIRLEETDDPSTRELSVLCRKLTHPLRKALRDQGYLTPKEQNNRPWLVLVMTSSTSGYLCRTEPGESSPHPMGVLRLKMPASAPSRSTLKLEEACRLLLGGQDQDWFVPGRWAVDLGAAPGGWTWQLVKRDQRVFAIDNGPMDEQLMASGSVEHLLEDGFRWQPPRPIDWLVCDMITQPQRTTELMLAWLSKGWAQRAIFNLKLPMKKSWPMVQACLAQLSEGLGPHYRIIAKQLYHDRDEVTVVVLPEPERY